MMSAYGLRPDDKPASARRRAAAIADYLGGIVFACVLVAGAAVVAAGLLVWAVLWPAPMAAVHRKNRVSDAQLRRLMDSDPGVPRW